MILEPEHRQYGHVVKEEASEFHSFFFEILGLGKSEDATFG